MAVTIKDVAAAAGVSPSTVSRTCKDSPSISRETKERVRRIMAQLGYEPNVEAEPVEAFSKTIGIILPSSQRDVYENAFHLEIIRGIGQFCNQRRYVNTVITGQDDAEVLDAIQSMVANAQADGFILLYSKKDCPVAAYLRSEGLLHVIVGKAAQSANQTIYIDNDNALAGEEAADYLYELGHRRIAYFGVSNALLFSAERKRGYQMSLLKHGITPREEDCVEVNTLNDAYEEPLKALLTAPDHPTAMLVSDDILAVVLEQFCGKLGLRVPKDLSIVSFNNSLFSRITSPQLTTVDVNPYQLGMEAASQTINHIENPNLLATKIIVPHKLIPRESAARRRRSDAQKTEAVPLLWKREGMASVCLFFSVFPRGHAEVHLERPVEIGEVFEAAPGSDGQDGLVCGLQCLGGSVQPVFVQKGDKALPGHLPEPAHEMAGAEGADPGGIGDPERLGIMGREPLQNGFQPLGVGCFCGELLLPLRNEQGKEAQQRPLDQQLVAGELGAVGFLQLPQAGSSRKIAQVVRGQTCRQRQAPALEWQQILLGAEVLCAAQKLQLKDDVFVFHALPLALPQRMEGAGRKNKDIPLVGRVGHSAHLHQPRAPLDEDQLHALLPVERHLREVSRNGAGIQIEGEPHGTVLLGLLQRSLILHRLTS